MKAMRLFLPLILVGGAVFVSIKYGPAMIGRVAYAVEVGKTRAARDELAELSKHDRLSVLFRAVAKAIKPAVVEVRVSKKVSLGGAGSPFDDLLRRHFGDDVPGPFRREAPGQRREFFNRGLGSGVIIDAENGYVLTNHHVVVGADQVEVVLFDKRELKAEWVRSDAQTDLAVIKIKPDRLIAAPLGDSDRMEVGDWVMAIGAPRGLAQTVTTGIVSAKGRTAGGGAGMYQDYIQTDAAINRGNSGGPLVNMRGEVIALNNSIMSYSGGFEGIGFAIPANMIKNIKDQLIDKGKVVRGYLGVVIQNVDENLAKSFRLPTTRGALVTDVAPGSPAAKAKVKEGDFIVSVNDKATPNVNTLRNVVAAIPPGTTVSVAVHRDGKQITLKVTLAPQPAEMAGRFQPRTTPGAPGESRMERFGLEVTTLTRGLAERYGLDASVSGVVVTRVDPLSDAAEQGVTPGMVVTHVQARPVGSAEAFRKALADKGAASGVRLRLRTRSGGTRFVFLTPKES